MIKVAALFVFLWGTTLHAGVSGIEHRALDKHIQERHVKLHVLVIQQGLFRVGVHSFHRLQHSRVAPKQFRQQLDALIVISGGFYHPDFRQPVGLVIENKEQIKPLSRHLSGVIWIKDNILYVSERTKFNIGIAQPDAALQGYPLLVDPVNQMGIYRPSSKLAYRVAVCTRSDEFLFIITDKRFAKMSLYELAEILQKPEAQGGLACDIAVNLDGGPAPGISVSADIQALEIHPIWQLPNVLVIQNLHKK